MDNIIYPATVQNANEVAELLDNNTTFHTDSEWTPVLIIWDYEHYKDIESHVEEMINNEEITHDEFYDEMWVRLDNDTSFILLH